MMRNSYWLPELFNDLMNAGTAVSRQAHTAPATNVWEDNSGYTVETWEFYPDDILVVKTMFLIPDKATPFVTPVTVCMATNEASVEGLSGEDDPYRVPCRPLALDAVRRGEIAVALALPGCANGAPDDLKSADSRSRYIAYLQGTDWTDAKLIELEKRMCQDFLRGRADFAK